MTTDPPIVTARRERLRAWIEEKHEGVQAGFVAATGINQGELSLLLKNKSFGERRAEAIEKAAGMPAGYLTKALDFQPTPQSQFTRYGADILCDAMALLDELDMIQGRRPEPRPNPARLALACEAIAAGGVEEGSVVVRLAEKLRQTQGAWHGNEPAADQGAGTTTSGRAGVTAAAKSAHRRAG